MRHGGNEPITGGEPVERPLLFDEVLRAQAQREYREAFEAEYGAAVWTAAVCGVSVEVAQNWIDEYGKTIAEKKL